MATTRGCFGKVKADTHGGGAPDIMAETKSWSYEETAEQIDVSSIGTCVKSFIAGAQQTSGSFETSWDTTDTAQGVFIVGNTIEFELYPGGSGSGAAYYKTPTGGAVITSISRAGSSDAVVTNNFGFVVNGALIATSVP